MRLTLLVLWLVTGKELAEAKTIIAAVGDSVTAGDHGLPPFASDDEGNYPFFLQGLLDDAAPGQFEVANLGLSGATTEEPSSPAELADADSIPLEDAILSVIDPPELRPRASRAPTPPPQRQGFGRGPSAAIIASPRNVVIEPVPRAARTASSQEVDELFEGAPPAADARVQGAERAEQVVREAGIGGNDDDDDAFKY